MAYVLGLEAEPALRQRIRIGVMSGGTNDLIDGARFASSWAELGRLADQYPGSPTFVDPFRFSDDESADWVAGFQRKRPHCPLILYATLDDVRRRRLERAAVAFVRKLVPGVNDQLTRIGAAALRSVCRHEVQALSRQIKRAAPPAVHLLLDCILDETVGRCPVDALAKHLGISTPTLRRRCAAHGLPSPRQLVALARLFHVERLAKWSDRPSSRVALALGYSNYANYARSVRNELGRSRSEIGLLGGADYVAGRLVEAVAGYQPGNSPDEQTISGP